MIDRLKAILQTMTLDELKELRTQLVLKEIESGVSNIETIEYISNRIVEEIRTEKVLSYMQKKDEANKVQDVRVTNPTEIKTKTFI
ncbi:MAG: hypothetical protein EOO46_17925 [Flavobacterium sp.]|nr:MAG: hypothetical protein EOO46_17925 [Flavobacterium sp.]